MNISAVSHRSTIEFCYASDENTVTVNIKTEKDVDRAFIISEDPFIHELRRQPHWSGVKTEMHKFAELKYHVIWTVKLQPRYKRLRYYFELESEGNTFVVCGRVFFLSSLTGKSRVQEVKKSAHRTIKRARGQ